VSSDQSPQIDASLVSRYAALRKQVGGMSESLRGMRFNALLADALVRDGIDADADQRGPHGEIDVAFCYDGAWWLLEAKWYADAVTDAPLRHLSDVLRERRPGTMGILASWSGFAPSALRRAERSRDVLLDRPPSPGEGSPTSCSSAARSTRPWPGWPPRTCVTDSPADQSPTAAARSPVPGWPQAGPSRAFVLTASRVMHPQEINCTHRMAPLMLTRSLQQVGGAAAQPVYEQDSRPLSLWSARQSLWRPPGKHFRTAYPLFSAMITVSRSGMGDQTPGRGGYAHLIFRVLTADSTGRILSRSGGSRSVVSRR
jgi:hypothetical protein